MTPDGQYAVSASQDDTLRVWNLFSRQSEQVLKGHSGAVYTVVVTPDGKRVISTSDDRTLRVWELETEREAGSSVSNQYSGASQAPKVSRTSELWSSIHFMEKTERSSFRVDPFAVQSQWRKSQ